MQIWSNGFSADRRTDTFSLVAADGRFRVCGRVTKRDAERLGLGALGGVGARNKMTKGAKNRRLLVRNTYSGPIIVGTIRRN